MNNPVKELKVTLTAVRITGNVYISNQGIVERSFIKINEITLPIEEASKENIIKEINNREFDYKKIIFANIYVDYIYIDNKNNHLIREGYSFETTKLNKYGSKHNGSN